MEKEITDITIWQDPEGLKLPPSIKEAGDIMPYAHYLTDRQKLQITKAFEIEAFDMAAEYAWKKSMVKLKETISTLGMKFVGEMIGRDDFDDATNIDSAITDFTAIQLAEQMGVIGTTAALRLKQSNELITHYFSKDADEELDYATAFIIVKSSVQYILGEQNISIAVEFSNFRRRLLNETLKLDDPQVEQIINSPLFYLRTTISILLSSIKNDVGAKLEHSLANLNMLIKSIWRNLAEYDKWHLGTAYRDTTASGNTIAATGLKNALLKVNGFDYVPENLRSITFITAAQQVIQAHYGYNNYYNEPAVIKKLSSLGSTIPAPAFSQCMQAYLAVYLGNIFGVSNSAAPIAEKELSRVSPERWRHYFEKIIHTDEIVLLKNNDNQIRRFAELLEDNFLENIVDLPRSNQVLYNAIIQKNYSKAKSQMISMYKKLKPAG